jgi:hypothetical protein
MDTLFSRSDGAPAPHSSDLKVHLTNLLSLPSRFSNKRMEFIVDHRAIFMRLPRPWEGRLTAASLPIVCKHANQLQHIFFLSYRESRNREAVINCMRCFSSGILSNVLTSMPNLGFCKKKERCVCINLQNNPSQTGCQFPFL